MVRNQLLINNIYINDCEHNDCEHADLCLTLRHKWLLKLSCAPSALPINAKDEEKVRKAVGKSGSRRKCQPCKKGQKGPYSKSIMFQLQKDVHLAVGFSLAVQILYPSENQVRVKEDIAIREYLSSEGCARSSTCANLQSRPHAPGYSAVPCTA